MSKLRELLGKLIQDSFDYGTYMTRNPDHNFSEVEHDLAVIVATILKEYDTDELGKRAIASYKKAKDILKK